ncbi:MAG: ATP-binding cassette domain-containing protein [Actinomycetota bacterium]|nr:branched-chain amino acid ABC transporter ATP-binding protein/permease [Actinomycetota bacterium]
MRPSPRTLNFVLAFIAFATIPPLLTRAMPGVFNAYRMGFLITAIAYVAGALSLNVLMGYAGQISLGQGALLGIGAFASGIVTTRGLALPLPVGIIVAAVVGGGVAFVIGVPALRLKGLYLAIVTIGFALMVEESFFKWRPLTRGSAGIEMTRRLFGHTSLDNKGDYLAFAGVVLIVLWMLDHNLVRTKLGRAMHGIREDESVAQSFGVNITRYKLTAFVISGAFAGVAGALNSHGAGYVNSETYGYITTPLWSMLLVIIVVIGGSGNRRGVATAAVFFALSPAILKFLTGWDLIVGAVLLIYTVAAHPGGFAEMLHEAREKKVAKAKQTDELVLPKLPDLPRPAGMPERPHLESGPLLEVKNVTVRFGGLAAVDDASIEVKKGQIVGLIGPNGAGKSTLFNVISGLRVPQTGHVAFGGVSLSDLGPHERAEVGIGRTFQLIGLAKNLSVFENFLLAQHQLATYSVTQALIYPPSVARVEQTLRERAGQAIDALGFGRYAETPVKNLSHGQQRLVELGCALVTAPELLLLDEPSAGFSPAAVENLTARLKDLRDELGRTVLLIEHNIPMVLELCDYIYVLNFGQILAQGTREEIASHPEVIAAYFGEEPAEQVPA